MEIKGKVHCFFEQSGTFKNEFIKLGIPAEDYDIQNNFGETDHVIDLFEEIEKGYAGEPSLFDSISKDDLILAFFPCIKFCNIAEYNQRMAQEAWRKKGVDIHRIYELLKKHSDERYFFYQKALKMYGAVEFNGLRMIMENPWHETNYTNYFSFMRPKAGLCSEERSLISPDYARNWICDFVLGKYQPEISGESLFSVEEIESWLK